MRLCTLRIGIYFLKDPGFRALVGLRDPFDDLCCVDIFVLKGYLYDPIDCVKPAIATEPGRVYRKDSSISITMKFINEVVNGGVTIILFVVTNLVCVPKKRNLSIFRGLEGAWKHIRTLELKWKNRCNSGYFGNGKIFGARRGVDPYHLDLVLISLFF